MCEEYEYPFDCHIHYDDSQDGYVNIKIDLPCVGEDSVTEPTVKMAQVNSITRIM